MDKLTKVLTYDITDDMNMSPSTKSSEVDQYHKRKSRFRLPLNQKIAFLMMDAIRRVYLLLPVLLILFIYLFGQENELEMEMIPLQPFWQ